MTACPRCDNSSYRLQELQVTGARYKYYSIQCSSCHAPIGVMDWDNIGAALGELDEKVDSLSAKVDAIESALNQISRRLRG